MKIIKIHIENFPPIKKVAVDNLGDVVIIAGANGSGKTRLKDALVQTFQNPSSPQVSLELGSTRNEEEKKYWKSKTLEIVAGTQNPTLESYMTSRTRGGSYTGTVIHIDSERRVGNIQLQQWNLSTPDPDETEYERKHLLSTFEGRWNEVVNSIFQQHGNRESKLNRYLKRNPGKTGKEILKANPDPFLQYQEVFHKLLPDKVLKDIDLTSGNNFKYETDTGESLELNSLSSGELEVVKIAFYILARRMTHCVFLIDEPELHLHPTLSFKLIETLKELGGGTNQFIFFTHSADLISTYYSTGNVYFIDSEKTGRNQAHKLSDLVDTHENLVSLMSDNLGLFAVGKKLIFVEGDESSIDRLTYNRLSEKYFPEAHIIATGSADDLVRLKDFATEISKAVFGINFFMIRDRDGLTDEQVKELEKNGRLLCLKRRQLENYFLDAEVLSKAAKHLYLDTKWHDPSAVEARLKEIAEENVNLAVISNIKEYVLVNRSVEMPTVRDLQNKSLGEIEKDFSSRLGSNLKEIEAKLDKSVVKKLFDEEMKKVKTSLQSNSWKGIFPGKPIFDSFCGNKGLQDRTSRVRQAYVDIALNEKEVVFEDIRNILLKFSKTK